MFKRILFLSMSILCLGLIGATTVDAGTITSGTVRLRYWVDAGNDTQTGIITLNYNNPPNYERSGYNFLDEEYTEVSGGAFYVNSENGRLLFFGNNDGQGGIVKLRNLRAQMPGVSNGQYNRMGVEVKRNGVYGVYDEANDIYIKIRVLKISDKALPVAVRPVVANSAQETTPTVTTPANSQTSMATVFNSQTKLLGSISSRVVDAFQNETITFTAHFDPHIPNLKQVRTEIVEVTPGLPEKLVQQCFDAQECSFSQTASLNNPRRNTFVGRAYDINKTGVESNRVTVDYGKVTTQEIPNEQPTTFDANSRLRATVASRTWTDTDETFVINAFFDPKLANPNQVTIEIWNVTPGIQKERVMSCSKKQECSYISTVNRSLPKRIESYQAFGHDSQKNTINSDTASVTLGGGQTISQTPLLTPKIITPTAQQNFSNFPRTLMVSWTDTGTKNSLVEIQYDYCASVSQMWSEPPLTYTLKNSERSVLAGPLARDCGFRVRVKGVADDGRETAWSDFVYFKFQTTQQPTTPAVERPGTLKVEVNATTVEENDSVKVVAMLLDSSIPASDVYIMIYDEREYNVQGFNKASNFVARCDKTHTCNATHPLTLQPNMKTQARLYAAAYRLSNNELLVQATFGPTITIQQIPPKPLTAPTIISPTSQQIFSNFPRTLGVSWTGVTNATGYLVHVECDYCESQTKWAGEPTEYNATNQTMIQSITVKGDNTYRLSVRAVNDTQKGPWSDYIYFEFKTGPSATPTPVILTPRLHESFAVYPRTINVTWSEPNPMITHIAEVTCDYCGSLNKWEGTPTHYTSKTNATSLKIPELAGANEYRLRLKAVDNQGKESAWSEYTFFRFTI